MSRFGVYKNQEAHGWVIDVQTDLMSDYDTRVVVPLMLVEDGPERARRLNPKFELEGCEVAMVTHYIATISTASLGEKVADFTCHQDEIMNALDMLFVGF